jgi:hypothetical protein
MAQFGGVNKVIRQVRGGGRIEWYHEPAPFTHEAA